MKNIERKEVQDWICCELSAGGLCPNNFEKFGYDYKTSNDSLGYWLNSEYEEPKKYHWRLKGSFCDSFIYLGLTYDGMLVLNNLSTKNTTEFSKVEFDTLAQRFGLCKEAFEKELI